MAYNSGGYPGQRPYPGPQHAPRRGGPGPGYAPPRQQQYESYGDEYNNYEYDQYDGGYAPQDFNSPPQEMNYGRGRPPPDQGYPQQDMYGGPGPAPGPGRGPGPYGPGRGGRPPPGGRGGPMRGPRGGPPPPGPGRGHPPPGRGRPGPSDRAPTMNPNGKYCAFVDE